MNVNLTPTLEAMVREKVESGLYNNASEVVREALRQMHERDEKLRILREEVAKGFEQLDRGEGISYTPELIDEMERELEKTTRVAELIPDAVKP